MICLRIFFIKNRKRLTMTVCIIRELNRKFGKRTSDKLKKLKMTCFAALLLIAPSFYITSLIRTCMNANEPSMINIYAEDSFFGWYSNNTLVTFILFLTFDIAMLLQFYVLPGFCAIFCIYSFEIMNQGISLFRNKLFSSHERGFEHFVRCYDTYTSKIFFCISHLEHDLSLILTLLQGYLTWNIFYTTSYLVKHGVRVMEIFAALTDIASLCITVFIYLCLNLSAAKIHDSAIGVKNSVFRIIADNASTDDERCSLILEMAAEFPSKVVITGWKLFPCKRGIILKTAGAVFTYGVILAQIG
ncbi:hypothetical protein AVEN_170196-1 [Araneus ventricosus]|uniref:Gustatory receptor n=1 Tax=Araneus ventricosus TaxID=182803 RepID=A0A4Y2Q323_ARAVE|nr:hypothetical protein AVEN_216097-1 [Araneus ventricosus]GBN57939.1 hypothetical protein AVEN_170196-1 [Araneus ventricosus]